MKRVNLWEKYKTKRRSVLVLSLIALSFLYAFKNYSPLVSTFSTIALLFIFYMVDHLFDMNFKIRHYIFISLIAVAGLLLSPLYYIYPRYDKIQHFIMPMMFASIGLHMVKRLKLELKWKLVFLFFLIIGGIGLFEIGEYALDVGFDLKLQGVFLKTIQEELVKYNVLMDRIDDTMIDMSLGVLGTGLYILVLSLWLYHGKKHFKKRRRKYK